MGKRPAFALKYMYTVLVVVLIEAASYCSAAGFSCDPSIIPLERIKDEKFKCTYTDKLVECSNTPNWDFLKQQEAFGLKALAKLALGKKNVKTFKMNGEETNNNSKGQKKCKRMISKIITLRDNYDVRDP